jgi:hypothetical protein
MYTGHVIVPAGDSTVHPRHHNTHTHECKRVPIFPQALRMHGRSIITAHGEATHHTTVAMRFGLSVRQLHAAPYCGIHSAPYTQLHAHSSMRVDPCHCLPLSVPASASLPTSAAASHRRWTPRLLRLQVPVKAQYAQYALHFVLVPLAWRLQPAA